MKLDARALREARKARIASRTAVTAKRPVKAEDADDDMPDWLEEKIDEDDGEAAVDDMPGEMGDDEMPMDEDADLMDEGEAALGAFNYNPVYQKPTHLGSNAPSGGYHYYGPPPDAGTSYGFYLDASTGLRLIAPKAKVVFSPISGQKMKFEGAVDHEALSYVLAVADRMTSIKANGQSRMTSAPLRDIVMSKLFDAQTGAEVDLTTATDDMDEDDMPPMDEEMPEDEAASMPSPMMSVDETDEVPVDEESMDDLPAEEPTDMIDDMSEPEEEPAESAEEPMESPVEEAEEPMEAPHDDELPVEDESTEEEEAVMYEALQELDDLDDDVAEPDVNMTLFDEEPAQGRVSANPYWNIDIKGMPIARVYLQDQDKPEEIREVFCSADYRRGVAGAIEKAGVRPVLEKIKARIWANAIHETKLARRIESKAQKDAQQRVTAVTTNLVGNLLQRIAIVCAGMDKNFYREVGNPLKEALWGEFHAFGIANPSPMIEAAFRKGSTRYFETVLNKAVEYMEMEPKALQQVQAAIGEADVLTNAPSATNDLPIATVSPEEMPTLAQRLAASSVAVGGIPAIAGDALGDHKRTLRSELRLGGAGPLRK
jgi:hypothetical protein